MKSILGVSGVHILGDNFSKYSAPPLVINNSHRIYVNLISQKNIRDQNGPHSNHMTSKKQADTLICHTTMHRDPILCI